MLTLNELNVGDTAVVKKIHGTGPVRRRIMDMGITKSVPLKVIRYAPLGDPMEITILGYELTLRKKDCSLIEVEKTSPHSSDSSAKDEHIERQ